MAPLTILVTGGNTGIGYFLIEHLLATGSYHVLMGARNPSKAAAAIEKLKAENPSIDPSLIEPLDLDVTSDASIAAAAKTVEEKFGKLDILVNNAGISRTAEGDGLRENMVGIYNTNVASVAIMTNTFAPLIIKSTAPAPGRRIVNIGSGLGSIASAGTGEIPYMDIYVPYTVSKTALNMLTVQSRMKWEGVTFVVTGPGYCATNLNGFQGPRDPRDGAKIVFGHVTGGTNEEMNGKYFEDGREFPW